MKIFVVMVMGCFLFSSCVSTGDLQQGDALHRQGRNVEALHHYEKALAEMGQYSSGRENLVQKIADHKVIIIDDTLKRGEQQYGLQPTLANTRKALGILQENSDYDDQQKRIAKRIEQYEGVIKELEAKHGSLLESAGKAMDQNRWSEAFATYNSAYIINPDNESVLEKRNSIIGLRASYYKDEIFKAVDNEDWRTADTLLASYKAELPTPEKSEYQMLDSQVKDLKTKLVAKEAKSLRRNNKYLTAYSLIIESRIDSLQKMINQIRKDGSAYYLSKIKREMSNVVPKESLIYLTAVKALMLAPKNSEIFKIHRSFNDKIDDWIRVNIAISGFGSPHNSPNVGVHFSDNLIAYLVAHLPYGIEILERSKIDLMLRESGQELKELSKKLGAKMFVIGNVSTLDIEHQKSERESTVVVTVGEKQEPNPQYNQMMSTYGTNTADWPNVPPMTIATKITEMVKYKMGNERMKGLMNVSTRIFDAEKGSITVAETFKANDDESDKYQDSVPAAGIEYDPLELPTDNEMKEKMIGELVAQVARLMGQAFEQREWRFLTRAKGRLERQELNLALDELAKGYLYCNLGGMPESNKYCMEIEKLALYEMTE